MPTSRSIAAGTLAQVAAMMLLLMAAPLSHAATITSVTATASTLTINGSGFSVGTLSVTLNAGALAVASRSDTTVTATLPTGLSSGVYSGMLTLSSRSGVQQHAFSVTISAPPAPGGSTVGALRVLDANGQFVGHFLPNAIYMPGSPIRTIGFDPWFGYISPSNSYFESPDCTGTPFYYFWRPSTSFMTNTTLTLDGRLAIATTDCGSRPFNSVLNSTGCSPSSTPPTIPSCAATFEPFPFVAPFRLSP